LQAAVAFAAVVVVSAILGSAAFGKTADPTPQLLKQAAADVAKYSAGPKSFAQYSPGPGPKATAGTKVGAMTCLWSIPACKRIADAMKAAAKAMGWSATVVDGTAIQSNQRTAMQSFLQHGVQGFMLAAIDPHGISDYLATAKGKHIAWSMAAGVDPRPFGGSGISADVTGGLYQAGWELGAWVANNSKGKANILMMSSTDNPALQLRDNGFKNYLKRFPHVKFLGSVIYVPFKDVGAPLQAQAQAIIQRYKPGQLNYIYTPFDGFATFVVLAAQSLNRKDVKVVSFDGAPQNLDYIRKGENQVATQATPWGWCAWLAADFLNRALHHVNPTYKGGCPSKVIDKSNAPPAGKLYDGDLNYQAAFKKLWGVSK
jgi:ribose transport system substrate-binding protein